MPGFVVHVARADKPSFAEETAARLLREAGGDSNARDSDQSTPLKVSSVKSYMIVYEAKKIGFGEVKNLILAEEEDGRFRPINGKELVMLAEAYPWFKKWATSPPKEDD